MISRLSSVKSLATAFCLGLILQAQGVGHESVVQVVLGERATNSIVKEMVVLPVAGPVKVAGLPKGAGMVSITPVQGEFKESDVVAVSLEIDLHGAEFLKGNLSATVVTSKGNYLLDIIVKPIPFTVYQPSRFGLTVGSAPVEFTFKRAGDGSPAIFDHLTLDPEDAPVSLSWVVGSDGSIQGKVGPVPVPAAVAKDGVIHCGRVLAVTKDGETDFMQFHWVYPKDPVNAGASGSLAGGGN